MTDRIPLAYTGDSMPRIGLGTFIAQGPAVEEGVYNALKAGYRLIDTAVAYGNHKEIGRAVQKAIADRVIDRGQLFVTSKLWNDAHAKEDVKKQCQKALEDLQMSYIDLFLIHWPVSYGVGQHPKDVPCIPIEETWMGMEELVRCGMVRNIGLSNFNAKQIQRILDVCTIPPAVLQVEIQVLHQQKPLIEFCKEHRIAVTGWGSMGSNSYQNGRGLPNLMENDVIVKIAEKHGRTPAQILLRWVYEQGCAVIPKSTNVERQKENLAITEFALDAADLEAIAPLDKKMRLAGKLFLYDGMSEEEWWNLP